MLDLAKINSQFIIEIIRYGIVGLIINIFGYMLYLMVTWLGIDPKMSITILYPLAILYGYFAHKRVSFSRVQGIQKISRLIRYIIVYCCGYTVNLGLLYVLHDLLGYPHQWIQIISIFVVAVFLFFALKLFVFKVVVKSKSIKI
jgi:putative flippase GtrA